VDIERVLDLEKELGKKSCFLFGPRQTGKTWLVRRKLTKYRTYNLLDSETYLKLSRNPRRLREEASPRDRIMIVDEIQKLPILLDEIHFLIEERGVHFLLTGSSARKLRRGGVNLLGGRARVRHLHPFSCSELKEHFDLTRALNHGLLPPIYFSEDPEEDLKAYVGTYLKEEIAAEGLTRNVPAFSRFLEVAALCNGRLINFTKISNDAQVARTTVQEYFQILKDTLVAWEVTPWRKSRKRKPISTSKFYFFDPGIARVLQNRSFLKRGSPEFGEALETYMFHELKAYADYRSAGEICYWRSTSGFEVDFILAGLTAIEIKGSRTIGPEDLKGLRALQEERGLRRYVMVSLEEEVRRVGGIEVLPWREFLDRLWAGDFSK
jgi:predicted AAA+ superfamily ATPase